MIEELPLNELKEGTTSFRGFMKDIVSKDMTVFYNPVMRENRDLSIMMILFLLSKKTGKTRLAFPMSASGIRELRLLSEQSDIISDYSSNNEIEFLINDINADSLNLAKENVKNAPKSKVKIKYVRSDARSFLIENKHFDYVEIDPFGTPIPFIDSALQSVKDKAIIGVTATDTSALTGTYPKVTKRKYDSTIILSPSMHEISVRVLAGKIIRHAASLSLGARLLFSYSDEHYVKLFFELKKGKKKADEVIDLVSYINLCESCGLFSSESSCPFCQNKLQTAGPLYTGDLWDENVIEFIEQKLVNSEEEFSDVLRKNIEMIKNEMKLSGISNTRFDIHRLSSIMKLPAVPKMDYLRNEFLKIDGSFSRTMFGEKLVRTDLNAIKVKTILCGLAIKSESE